MLRDSCWGTDGHIRCFGSFFQEDYIPYPSIDEVGALNLLNAFPKLLMAGELVEILFLRGAACSPSIPLWFSAFSQYCVPSSMTEVSERGQGWDLLE